MNINLKISQIFVGIILLNVLFFSTQYLMGYKKGNTSDSLNVMISEEHFTPIFVASHVQNYQQLMANSSIVETGETLARLNITRNHNVSDSMTEIVAPKSGVYLHASAENRGSSLGYVLESPQSQVFYFWVIENINPHLSLEDIVEISDGINTLTGKLIVKLNPSTTTQLNYQYKIGVEVFTAPNSMFIPTRKLALRRSL